MMKHISVGYRRICGKPVPESGQYVTDAEWRKLPECPTCYANYQPTLAIPEPKLHKDPVPQKPVSRGLYLRDYLEEIQ